MIGADSLDMARLRVASADAGFTLVEVSVSLAIIGVVMASVTSFFVSGVRGVHHQGEQQTAAHLAMDGMEQARALRGEALLAGRAVCAAACPTVGGVAGFLAGTERWDGVSPTGAASALPHPADAVVSAVDGVEYRRFWYVGKCWQPRGGGACVNVPANPLLFYRVVVVVTWSDSACADQTCLFVTSAQFSGNLHDPIFRPA